MRKRWVLVVCALLSLAMYGCTKEESPAKAPEAPATAAGAEQAAEGAKDAPAAGAEAAPKDHPAH